MEKSSNITCPERMKYSVSGLIPAQVFTVSIAAVNAAGDGKVSTLKASTTNGRKCNQTCI